MGKKYIVELGRCERLYKAFVSGNEKPGLTWLSPEIDLTPYTEPDFEQVRKEAYEEGKKQAKVQAELDVCHDIEKVAKENYKAGLADAWDAARKIAKLDTDEQKRLFGCFGISFVAHEFSAHEAIEKIRQYEQEQEYHVGDEFENGAGKKFVVLKMDGKEIDRYIDGDGKTYVMKEKYRVMRKTGRSFPEIAAVLEKMRGEQE